jgi:hypothetical protein
VNTNENELAPIVWDTWNDMAFDSDRWITDALNGTVGTNNKTVLDDVFGWGNTVDAADPNEKDANATRPGKSHFSGRKLTLAYAKSSLS